MQTQSRIGITVLKMGMVALVAVGLWAVVPVFRVKAARSNLLDSRMANPT